VIPWTGRVWRILLADRSDPLAPARAPEGRFHHDGQAAIYTSLSPEGCGVAIRRYLATDTRPRIIAPLKVRAMRVRDLRGNAAEGALPPASVIWQDARAQGLPASTWGLSDAARRDGAQAVLYRSRSRPDLTHMAIFDTTVLTRTGSSVPWP